MRPLFPLFLCAVTLVAALGASGCGEDSACVECPAVTFGVEVVGGPDGRVALVDGARIPWVWGPQGGTMILPDLVFDSAEVPIGLSVDVKVHHSPDPDAPDRFGQAAEFLELHQRFEVYADLDSRPTIGPINDQLGWTELDGTRLTWAVEVSSASFATSTAEAVIELAPMATNIECEPFAVAGAGCTYRAISGMATVVSLDTPTGYACTDATEVTLSFTPDDPEGAEECVQTLSAPMPLPTEYLFTLGSGASPPTSCLAPLGIAMGASLPATLAVIERGLCAPLTLRLELDTTRCDAECAL